MGYFNYSQKAKEALIVSGSVNIYFVIFPVQTGTATSSPTEKTAAQSNMNICKATTFYLNNQV